MSSQHQSRRRRSYGRREHEVRERRQREESINEPRRLSGEMDDEAEMRGLPVRPALRSLVSVVTPQVGPNARASLGGPLPRAAGVHGMAGDGRRLGAA